MPDATPARSQRTIEAPALDWLTVEEAVLYLRLNGSVWESLVRTGWVPGLRRLSSQVILVPWQAVVVLEWRLLLGEEPPGNPAETGKTRPKPGKPGETGE